MSVNRVRGVLLLAATVGGVAGVTAGAATAAPTPAPAEYVAAADAATAQCDEEVVDSTLVLAQIRAYSGFDQHAQQSASGAAGPAQFTAAQWAIWGADDDGNGVASPTDVADAVGALTRYDCSLTHGLTAAGHPAEPVDVLAAAEGGVDNVDRPEIRQTAEMIWSNR